ncbi:MAG: hypothetical protein M3N04_08735 [Actinomycetota bacterium]|nr:hypothetical protein [Actinomycetota bacterium]
MTRIRSISFIALTTLLLWCVAPALAADSPVNDAYGGQAGGQAGGQGGGQGGEAATNLPFSGLDLGLIAAGGFMLVALGFTLRRAARSH